MMTVDVRKQGGAAIMTIPADVLRMLDIKVGQQLQISVSGQEIVAKPIPVATRKRYTLDELLKGATPATMKKLMAQTAGALDGAPVGRELA
jgi:antitoxin ChpS